MWKRSRVSEQPASGKDRGIARSTPVEWAVRGLTSLSSVAVAVLLVATFVGVIMRYFFSAPILGVNEIIQMGSVALVMLAMPDAAHTETHVRVDVFDKALGRWGRLIGDLLARSIGIYLLGVLTWRAWLKMLDAMEYRDVTNMISIPFWPFYGLVALSCVLYAIILFLQVIDILRGRSPQQ